MNWKTTLAATVFVAAAALAQGASATPVYSDNFNDGTATILNWTGDTLFSSPASYAGYTGTNANASTDYVATGTFGITCYTGSQGCVDLDGTTGFGNDPAGVLQSVVNFGANTYTVTFELSGSQRAGSLPDTTLVYFGNQLVDSVTTTSTTPFTLESATFTSATGGTLAFVEKGPSDQVGALLDDVTLSVTAVPEPATWALMLVGFGGLGLMLRRRGRALAV